MPPETIRERLPILTITRLDVVDVCDAVSPLRHSNVKVQDALCWELNLLMLKVLQTTWMAASVALRTFC